jgi:hypothetical protein
MFRSGIFMGHPQRLGHRVEAPLQDPTLLPTPTVASSVAKISQSWSGPYDLPAGEVATTGVEDLARADDGFRLAWLAAVAVGGVEVDPLLMGNVHVIWPAE